ncbi:copper resistance protein CopC [Corynebacterium sp. TAE3-ERU12]|nr:copper resistance protein CopC [Corynebacterium sp. TAE3-ERU12]
MARRCGASAVVASALAASSMLGLNTPIAAAHDSVIKSVPANGATVDEFPHHVELTFSGEPRPNFNTVAISDVDSGEVLFTKEPDLDGQLVTIDIPGDIDPGPGEYIVGFQITSSDGHSTRGKVGFTVADDGDELGTDGTAADQSLADAADDDSIPTWAVVGGVAVIVLIVGVVAGVAIRNRKHK